MKHTVLAFLAHEPAHGYEIKQAIEQTFGEAWPPLNIGQIYTTLGRLERDGLVRSQEVPQSNRPNKRVYEVTEDGRAELRVWLREAAEGPRLRDEFFTKLVLAGMPGVNAIDGVSTADLINRQRRHYLQALRDLNGLALQQELEKNPAAALLIEGAVLHLQADLMWLDLCEQRLLS